jgi:hypothetical protein
MYDQFTNQFSFHFLADIIPWISRDWGTVEAIYQSPAGELWLMMVNEYLRRSTLSNPAHPPVTPDTMTIRAWEPLNSLQLTCNMSSHSRISVTQCLPLLVVAARHPRQTRYVFLRVNCAQKDWSNCWLINLDPKRRGRHGGGALGIFPAAAELAPRASLVPTVSCATEHTSLRSPTRCGAPKYWFNSPRAPFF